MYVSTFNLILTCEGIQVKGIYTTKCENGFLSGVHSYGCEHGPHAIGT